MNTSLRNPRHLRPPGTVLIVTMVVTFALAGAVLVLCRTMRVEAMASANLAASVQASAVERGAEQYVLGLLQQESEQVRELDESQFAAVRIGDGYFWILRPQFDDGNDGLPVFGLMEESAKLNLNVNQGQTFDRLMRLPGMELTPASCIMDWQDPDNNSAEPGRDGAESDYYLGLPEPYYCKDGPFETVEELLLVRGVVREMLYGDGTAPPLGQRSSGFSSASVGGLGTDPQIARGLYDVLTVYSQEPNTGAERRVDLSQNRGWENQVRRRLEQRLSRERAGQIVSLLQRRRRPRDVFEIIREGKLTSEETAKIANDFAYTGANPLRGLININAAPRSVLRSLTGLEDADVDRLIAARQNANLTGDNLHNIFWVSEALGGRASLIGNQVTTRTLQWSADILAVSGNGRAFKRARIVVDTKDGTPQIIYRRDLTDRGWPMDRQILASIRAGQFGSGGFSNSTFAARGGGI